MGKEGWTWLHDSRKDHYFVDGQSLCGKFMLMNLSGLSQGNDDGLACCASCRRKLKSRQKVKGS